MLRRKASSAKDLVKNKAKQYIESLDSPEGEHTAAAELAGLESTGLASPFTKSPVCDYDSILEELSELQKFVDGHSGRTKEATEGPREHAGSQTEPEETSRGVVGTEQVLLQEHSNYSLASTPHASPQAEGTLQPGLYNIADPEAESASICFSPAERSFPVVDVAYYKQLPTVLLELGEAPAPPQDSSAQLEMLHWKKPEYKAPVDPRVLKPSQAIQHAVGAVSGHAVVRAEDNSDSVQKSMPMCIPKPITLAQSPPSFVSPVQLGPPLTQKGIEAHIGATLATPAAPPLSPNRLQRFGHERCTFYGKFPF